MRLATVGLRGAGIGALVGAGVALGVGLLVIGTDDIPDIADAEDLPVLYLIAALIGAVIGAVSGAVGLVLAARAAQTTSGDPSHRRMRGALVAGGVLGIGSLVLLSPLASGFGVLLVGVLLIGPLAGAISWAMLPGLVDLSSIAAVDDQAPAWGTPAPPAALGPKTPSTFARVAMTVPVAGLGAFLVTQTLMSFLPVDREVAELVAIGVLAVSFVILAVLVWRRVPRWLASGAGRRSGRDRR
ncbi:hypothetical protein [Aeromicrobium sp.]|uniref:hypothetical protein n=1 Tax=Aeromicrobium sp. TaxID=1871063 RepID=UPI0030C36DFA